jgi:hypothetical protein
MKNWLYRWTGNLPLHIISDNGRPYLERYFLFKRFGVTGYVHRFVASDPDRGLHSHPWPWAVSIKLSGWYFEERPTDHPDRIPALRIPGRVSVLAGSSFHRVVLPWTTIQPHLLAGRPYNAECWTLFIHRSKRSQWWGFLSRQPRDEDGVYTYRPYRYPDGASTHGDWWKSVPKGKDNPDRQPMNG